MRCFLIGISLMIAAISAPAVFRTLSGPGDKCSAMPGPAQMDSTRLQYWYHVVNVSSQKLVPEDRFDVNSTIRTGRNNSITTRYTLENLSIQTGVNTKTMTFNITEPSPNTVITDDRAAFLCADRFAISDYFDSGKNTNATFIIQPNVISVEGYVIKCRNKLASDRWRKINCRLTVPGGGNKCTIWPF